MAYTAWSVVFGEQPSAAKWNQLGTNDAGFKDGTLIDDDAITSEKLDATIGARAYSAGGQSVATATITTLEFDTENFDLGADYNTGTYQFTAPKTGYYLVTVQTQLLNLTAAVVMTVYIYVNGAAYAQKAHDTATTNFDPIIDVNSLCAVTSGQTIDGRVQHNHGSNRTSPSSSLFSYISIAYIGS